MRPVFSQVSLCWKKNSESPSDIALHSSNTLTVASIVSSSQARSGAMARTYPLTNKRCA
jgi:hypothetical protein